MRYALARIIRFVGCCYIIIIFSLSLSVVSSALVFIRFLVNRNAINGNQITVLMQESLFYMGSTKKTCAPN